MEPPAAETGTGPAASDSRAAAVRGSGAKAGRAGRRQRDGLAVRAWPAPWLRPVPWSGESAGADVPAASL